MRYYYDKERIENALERIKGVAPTAAAVRISDHFAGGKSSVIEVRGIDGYSRSGAAKVEEINRILSEELGEDAYLECWDVGDHVCYIGVDDAAGKGSKYDPIVLDGRDMDAYPNPRIWAIQNAWKMMTEKSGDEGSCVLGECFWFSLGGKHYRLDPLDMFQGSASREKYAESIRQALKAEGCEDVRFDYGIMD